MQVGLVTLCSPHSAEPVFTRSALSLACDWKALQSRFPTSQLRIPPPLVDDEPLHAYTPTQGRSTSRAHWQTERHMSGERGPALNIPSPWEPASRGGQVLPGDSIVPPWTSSPRPFDLPHAPGRHGEDQSPPRADGLRRRLANGTDHSTDALQPPAPHPPAASPDLRFVTPPPGLCPPQSSSPIPGLALSGCFIVFLHPVCQAILADQCRCNEPDDPRHPPPDPPLP